MVGLKYGCWLACLGLVVACAQPDAGPTPAEVQELSPILADLHLAEAMISELPISLRDSTREAWYQQVLDDHQYNWDRLTKNTDLMRSEPEWLMETYRLVQEELAKKGVEAGREN